MTPSAERARVLVFNAGSSSLKLSVVAEDEAVADRCDIDKWDGSAGAGELRDYLGVLASSPGAPTAIGHRVVHGGSLYTEATPIDDAVRAGIVSLTPLAPLHQPRALAGIDAATAAFPGLPQVACFDTAFHADMPRRASTYPLPADWRDKYGLRKYGFHGLSHRYASRRAAQILQASNGEQDRLVTCHLGAGSSLAAVQGGHSVETTMGFTPVDGLVMATRSGSVDPGMIAWLASRIPPAELAEALEHRSGLAALAGLADGSGDYRDVAAAADRGEPAAVLALDIHAHRLAAAIAAMAAAMNGLDALVFTGGIGEHAPQVRARAAAALEFLGVAIDAEANAATRADADISAQDALIHTIVVTAREDLEVARSVLRVLSA
ncbi:MAG: acetate/propionate family kinase [Nocardiopsaceae bacterium]|jgi:acetate kinase|nr:acetate/propionate family kinase [Nocardiopsaceae bacterium]